MIVVSNTSPIRYLVLVHSEHVLPVLFGEVFVPPPVLAELQHARSPEEVRTWALSPPDWLKIQSPNVVDATLGVDQGEAAAISLAMELRADALLIDDRKGRNAARSHGVPTVGPSLFSKPRRDVACSICRVYLGNCARRTFACLKKCIKRQ
jgi:predicted nucleic acid-binding protein